MTLSRLAALYGVATSYSPSPDRTVRATDAAVIAALAALDVDASTPEGVQHALDVRESELRERVLPPTVVCWRGGPDAAGRDAQDDAGPWAGLPPGTRLRVDTEDGARFAWETADTSEPGPGPEELPLGVHHLTATVPGRDRPVTAHLVVAPYEITGPPDRGHGFLVQLYSLLSARSWGMGDLGDLAELASWAGRRVGCDFVQVNPLHAAVPGPPGGTTDPSPYRPSSRRFPDPVHLRVEEVPEYTHLTGAARDRVDVLLRRAAELRESVLRKGALIDRDAVWALKKEALELIAEIPLGPGRCADYGDFLAEHGEDLEAHATWCALAEAYGPDPSVWPPALRDPASAGTARARNALLDRVDFHSRLAWLTDAQLGAAQRAAREAGMATGLVHDLAVGVHPDGADAWAQRDVFAASMSVGAPPDAFNAHGQDWGLPPWRPDRLAASGYAPLRAVVGGLLRHAGALRVDHIMGLFRLWWIPVGGRPTDGTYVHYDAEAMLAVLCLEAHRAGAFVIGEDLGTVEPGVRETLHRHGVLGTSVLWFEREWVGADGGAGTGRPLPPEGWRAGCLATATTHDLPPTAARITGEHVELRHRLGLLARPLAVERAAAAADVAEWLGVLSLLGLLPGGGGWEEDEIRAVHRFLLRTPARMVGVWLPDTVGDRRPQNLPGTRDEYPNWRLPLAGADGRPLSLEELTASRRLHAFMEVFRSPAATRAATRTAPPGARPV
ncbi:4-alpha-glucanotransferase [Actinomycetota bacterium Odt1-20B]